MKFDTEYQPKKRGKSTGRKPIKLPPESKIEEYARTGATDRVICNALDLKQQTLRRHFGKILKETRAKLDLMIYGTQVRLAIGMKDTPPSERMLIHLGKVRLGQRETVRNEQTGAGGGPIRTQEMPIDLSRLSDEELAAIAPTLEKLKAK